MNLKELLKEKGVRHDYFATEIMMVTPSTLSRWIKKISRPPRKKIDTMCEYFDVFEDDLGLKKLKELK